MGIQNFYGENLNNDIEMEISLDIVEVSSSNNNPSLHSWKRILRSSKTPSSSEAHENSLHSTKRPLTESSLLEPPTLKKQAIESDSLNIDQSFAEGSLPSHPPIQKF